jgi:hypothetical protein
VVAGSVLRGFVFFLNKGTNYFSEKLAKSGMGLFTIGFRSPNYKGKQA